MAQVSLDSEDFRSHFMGSGNSPATRLKRMGKTLSAWHKARLANSKNEQAELSLADIHGLRQLIGNEVGQLRLRNPEVVADQILFLVIGAIRLQLHNDPKQQWELVNSSIAGFLRPPRTYHPMLMGLSAISIAAVLAISLIRLQPAPHPAQTTLFAQDASGAAAISEAGMNSVNNLVAIYHRMQRGECQLPQAAMLQPEEREAFISFIHNGHVELDSADSLKKSLQYVNCLYPQKLMGPL